MNNFVVLSVLVVAVLVVLAEGHRHGPPRRFHNHDEPERFEPHWEPRFSSEEISHPRPLVLPRLHPIYVIITKINNTDTSSTAKPTTTASTTASTTAVTESITTTTAAPTTTTTTAAPTTVSSNTNATNA